MRCVKFACLMAPAMVLLLGTSCLRAQDADDTFLKEKLHYGKGFCVHMGSDDGALTLALLRDGAFLVQRLDADASRVETLRRRFLDQGVYGQVSVEHFAGKTLPYVDHLGSLLVVDEGGDLTEPEILRVLSPLGTAFIRSDGKWRRIDKPWPKGMSEWHQPVSAQYPATQDPGDVFLDAPNGLQWVSGTPVVGTSNSKRRALVSSNGRVFCVTNNVYRQSRLAASPSQQAHIAGMPNYIEARNAFNGTLLWIRNFPGSRRPVLSTDLVASGDCLFVLGNTELQALDAATGEPLRKVPMKPVPLQMRLADEGLLLYTLRQPGELQILNTQTLEKKWSVALPRLESVEVNGGKAYALIREGDDAGPWRHELRMVELTTGKASGSFALKQLASADAQIQVLDANVVGILDGIEGKDHRVKPGWKNLLVYSAKDGSLLWEQKVDTTFMADGHVWTINEKNNAFIWRALDPLTGEKRSERSVDFKGMLNLKCQPALVTGRYLINSRRSLFIDLATLTAQQLLFYRGGCMSGGIPANGLYLAPPHDCACQTAYIRGYTGVHSRHKLEREPRVDDTSRLEKGPAFDVTKNTTLAKDAWPMYRSDAKRSSCAASSPGERLQEKWSVDLSPPTDSPSAKAWLMRIGSIITPPVVADGRVYLAVPQTNQVLALDAADGERVWSFTADARVTTPPTIHEGLCLFGSQDGRVYSLRADDGRLAWRFLAAPMDRRILAFEQVESAWPVAGTVLVHDGKAFVSAGRSASADGGAFVWALEPASGKALWTARLGDGEIEGVPDMMISDGHNVYVRDQGFNLATGERIERTPLSNRKIVGVRVEVPEMEHPRLQGKMSGWLEGSWIDLRGATIKGLQSYAYKGVHGELIAFSDDTVCAFRYDQVQQIRPLTPRTLSAHGAHEWSWQYKKIRTPFAMVLTPRFVYMSGAEGSRGFLEVTLLDDGRVVHELQLDSPPVFEGMAVAESKLFLSTQDGRLHCFVPQNQDDPNR